MKNGKKNGQHILKKRNKVKVFSLINCMIYYKTIIIKKIRPVDWQNRFDNSETDVRILKQYMLEMVMQNIEIMDPSISAGLIVIHTEKKSYRILTTNHTQINSRLIKDLISRLTEDNLGGYINDLRIG